MKRQNFPGKVPVRGFLIHFSHYDPVWCRNKSREKPFDLDTGLKIVNAMAEVGLNLLVIDCADGVRYKSHPELVRKYTVPLSYLKELVNRAKNKGIEVVPKLNFSQSNFHQHNHWFRPHNKLFDNKDYWRIAFEIIDELIQTCRPERYFHIGMDEDHDRSHSQYIKAILELRNGLKKRGLRTVIWHDSTDWPKGLVHTEKAIAAEKKIPKDIIQIPWDYSKVRPEIVRRLINKGFNVWIAPGSNSEQVLKWRKVILRYGGKGMLMSRWIPCNRSNRPNILKLIRDIGPIYSQT